jgi:hypothetical protein
LVKTARYCFPLSAAAALNLYVLAVAPLMSVQEPPTGRTCQRTVGVGLPVPVALNEAVRPAATVRLVGFALIPLREDAELAAMIRSGDVAYELVRPVYLYGFWFARIIILLNSAILILALIVFAKEKTGKK